LKLTVEQAAELSGIPAPTLYRWIMNRVLPRTKLRGEHKLQYFINPGDLEKLSQKKET